MSAAGPDVAFGRRLRIGGLVAALAGALLFVLLLRLGFWQLSRAEYKEALEQRYAINSRAAPTALADVPPAAAADGVWRYRRVGAHGRFLAEHQYLLDNRTRAGRAGYHVLTPLRGAHGLVLVDRGWVPVGPRRDRLPDVTAVQDEVRIDGLLAPPPRPGLLLGESGYASEHWPKVVQHVDLERIGAQLGTEPLPVLLLLDPGNPACFVCDWSPSDPRFGPERHRGYALQWFSLAATLAIIVAVLGWRRWRRA